MDGSVPLSKRQASVHWVPGAGLVPVEVSHDVVSFASAEACQVEYAGVLKGAAQFWLNFLVADASGHLVVTPSYSPEHGQYSAGAAMSFSSVSVIVNALRLRRFKA